MRDKFLTNVLDSLADDSAMTSSSDTLSSLGDPPDINADERRVLDKVGEALARLGRVKRVGLTVRKKAAFIEAWSKRKK